MAKRKAAEVPMIDANLVWAAACAALRINGKYLKEPEITEDTNTVTYPNKVIMRDILFAPESITNEDRTQAEVVRTYWRNKMMEVLSGTANQFTTQAIELANRTEFAANDWLGLATVAFLPEGYVRGQKRDEQRVKKQEATFGSNHFGKIGEKVVGNATVIESRYSEKWGTHYVTAQFGTNVMFFAYRNKLEDGVTIAFKGTIKAHRDDGITQLNRVRIL